MKGLLWVGMLILCVGFVNAWHCSDTDASQPVTARIAWGDNGLLGGSAYGWGASDVPPAGCTGSQGQYTCNDYCDGTTLREYYCDLWSDGGTIIAIHDYPNSNECIQVPEFGVVAGGIALIGALGIFLYRRK